MKSLLLVFVFLFCLNSFAQDSRLFENTWYLHSLTVDGNTQIPPVNNEIPFVPADFYEDGRLETGMCESSCSGNLIYNGTSEFTVKDFAILTGGCYENDPFNENFNGMYAYGFWNFDGNPYSYNIVENGSERTLTLTSSTGNEAIFGNTLLSNYNFTSNFFSIYPNPSQGEFFIKNLNNLQISQIKIYDISGKILFMEANSNSEITTLNVQDLPIGIYFISIEDSQNRIELKKIIKQ